MRKLLWFLIFAVPMAAQVSNPGVRYVNTAPSGSCPAKALPVQVSATNQICTCGAGTWVCSSGGGGGTPGGSNGQAQYNNAGAFGGSPFTLDASGNATVPAGAGINMQAVADPGAGLTATLAGLGAGNVDNGIHDYSVTCTTAAGTTSPAPITSVTVTDNTTNGQVALTGIPVCDSPLVTSKQLYRTLAGIDCNPGDAVGDQGVTGCAYYALGAPLDPATTTYTDNTADADIESNPLIPLTNTTPGGISGNGVPTFYAGTIGGYPLLTLPNFASQAIIFSDNGNNMNPNGFQGAIFSCASVFGSDSCLWLEGVSGGDVPGIWGEADMLVPSVNYDPAIAWYAWKEGANPGDPAVPLGAGDLLWGVDNQDFPINSTCSNTTALIYGDGTFCVQGPLDTASPQTTVNCSTSGTAVYSQPLQGISDKKVVAVLAACLGTATYTFPTAFTVAPDYFIGGAATGAVVSAISTTAVTITITGTAISGTITLEGY